MTFTVREDINGNSSAYYDIKYHTAAADGTMKKSEQNNREKTEEQTEKLH